MKNSSALAVFLLVFAPLTVSAQVVINEIMYDLPDPGGDTGREWIEIQNIGSTAVDLSGWKLFEGGTNHNLIIAQGNNMLPVGGFAVLADKPDKFLVEHAGFSGTLFDSVFSLNNTTGEKLVLKNASSTVMSEIAYVPSWGAKGDGDSLQYFPDGWKAAVPTPGAINVKSVPKVKSIPPTPAVSEPVTTKEIVAAKQKPIVKEVSPLSASSTGDVSVTTSTRNSSNLVWWFLLGGVIVVASLAYWIGGRSDPDEFTIIEDTDNI